jgi:vacuolar iron transporter family protein
MTSTSGLSSKDRRTQKHLFLSRIVARLRGRTWKVVPHPGPIAEHRGGGRSGALRAAIFGVDDGLVSNLSLIFGVAGAGVDNDVVIVAGIAGLVAGAFSMAAGEYISVRTQREVYERLMQLEAQEIGSDPEIERRELVEIYAHKGLSTDLAERLATELMRDPEAALETAAREELGLDKEGLGSPAAAAGSSLVMFALGAFVPLIPFLVTSGIPAVTASAILSGLALFGVGAAMSYLTGRPWMLSGLRMLAVGGSAAAITFLVGELLNVSFLH